MKNSAGGNFPTTTALRHFILNDSTLEKIEIVLAEHDIPDNGNLAKEIMDIFYEAKNKVEKIHEEEIEILLRNQKQELKKR